MFQILIWHWLGALKLYFNYLIFVNMGLSYIHVQTYSENMWLTLCYSSKMSYFKRCWDWLQVCKPISSCIKIQVHYHSTEGVMADVIQLLRDCMIDGANGDWCNWHAMAPKTECAVYVMGTGIFIFGWKNESKIIGLER